VSRIQAPTAARLRERLSAWARYVYAKNKYGSVAAMSKDVGHNQGALNDIINGKGTTGLEFAVKLALAGQESLDTLCLRDPAPEFFRSGPPRASGPEAATSPPHVASEEPSHPRKRRTSGGR
jgi:hypothetical protein